MHAMLSDDYKIKVSCMAAGAPAAFCRTSRRGFASPQSARSSYYCEHFVMDKSYPLMTALQCSRVAHKNAAYFMLAVNSARAI